MIGAFNIGTDKGDTSPFAKPWDSNMDVRSRHFDIPLGGRDSRENWAKYEMIKAIEAWKNGNIREAYEHLGQGLHSLQDRCAHKNWDNEPHPYKWHGPGMDDWSKKTPEEKCEVEALAKNYLKEFLEGIQK